ncbi:MAG: antitoxin Xre/MbcA/ParS toxin-binding domain-containing protein [Cycloclasticus sp.]|jgi:putative toxin-antitoxin system antitoxin component, TIGR02293 family
MVDKHKGLAASKKQNLDLPINAESYENERFEKLSKTYAVSAKLLGKKKITHQQIIAAVKAGIRTESILILEKEFDSTQKEISTILNISASTMARRFKAGFLNMAESGRVFRLARLKERALGMTLGDNQAAISWLRAPQEIFKNESPLEHAATELGAGDVDDLIGRIQYGVFS